MQQSILLQPQHSRHSKVEIIWTAAPANRNTRPYLMASKLISKAQSWFKNCLTIVVNSSMLASTNSIRSTRWPMQILAAPPTIKWCLWTCNRHKLWATSQWQRYQALPHQTNKTSKCKKCYLVRTMKLSQDSTKQEGKGKFGPPRVREPKYLIWAEDNVFFYPNRKLLSN